MKLLPVVFLVSMALSVGARADEPGTGSYVLLGTQSGGSSATMAFVDNYSLSRTGAEVHATTMWVSPTSEGRRRGYVLKDDVYYCDQHKISHRNTSFYDFDLRRLTGNAENPGSIHVGNSQTLAGLVFEKICAGHPTVAGAENGREMAALEAAIVLFDSVPKTGKYAYRRPPLPPRVSYYPAGIASTADISIPPNGAYGIPTADRTGHIFSIYRAPDRHLIFEYYHGTGKTGESNFYDTREKRDLFPGQGVAMATSPGGLLGEELKPQGLEKLNPSMAQFSRPVGKNVGERSRAGTVCGGPYASSMDIDVEGVATKSVAFFRRLPKSRVWTRSCEIANVSLHYDQADLEFVAADDKGFFALDTDSPRLIHFDWNGRSAYFSREDDLIAVPYGEIESDLKSVLGVRRAEAVIAKYGARQLKGASPLLPSR
jgi:hypothetical protein